MIVILTFLMLTPIFSEPTLDKHMIPLHGNATLGYYYANVYIGTPPQQQSVITDTGSGVLALPCSKCISCGLRHIQVPFRLQDSKTSKFVTCNTNDKVCSPSCNGKRGQDACTFSISYAEGSSLSGMYISDEIQFEFGSQGQNVRAVFGCTTKQTNLFYTQAANGIFGLAPERQNNLLETLIKQHAPSTGQKLLFSLCLATEGGQLVIGKIKNELHLSNVSVTTSYNPHRNLYSLDRVGQIRLGKELIKHEGETTGFYGVFIDSGSTFTYLPAAKYHNMLRILQTACSLYPQQCLIAKSRQICFKITHQSNSTLGQTLEQIFPSFDVVLAGHVVSWSPAKYLMRRHENSPQVCLGVQSLDRYILGANWMVDRDIVFDLQNKTIQIFSDAVCELNGARVAHTEVPVYAGAGKQELSYIQAIQQLNNGDLGIMLIILVVIIGIFILLLILLGKCCTDKKIAPRAQDEQSQRIKQPTSERRLSESKRIRSQKFEKIETMVLE